MAEHSSTTSVPLIPRDVLFGNPQKMAPALSPCGKYLAYLAPDDRDVLQVWVRTLGADDDRRLTADKKRGIRMYHWAYDGRQLLYLQDADGDENWHYYAVELATGITRDLTPFVGVQARMVALDPSFPDQALVGMNVRDARCHDVYRVDLRTGAVVPVAENPGHIESWGIAGWVADADYKLRAAVRKTDDGGTDLLYRPTPDDAWSTLIHWGPDDEGGPVRFSRDGKTLYLRGSHDANASRLIGRDLVTGRETVLAEDPQYDVGGVMMHPTERTVQAVSFNRERLEWQVIDPSVAADFDAVSQIRPGVFGVGGRDLADRHWIVACSSDDGPTYYHLYRRDTRSAEMLFCTQPRLEDLPLASMQPVSFTARDGLTIHAYLTTPVGVEGRGLPTVLHVHGGPWARDAWGLNPSAQWLANRGYAVLQVNYRGSAGYGKALLNAGNREWAGKMHDDLVDAVEWLVGREIADRHRVAIMGGSYGGYATLVGLTFTPELFCCGVDIVGPSSLVTLLRSIPPYWVPLKSIFTHRVGDPDTETPFLESRSPLTFAERICRPLLIGQGANDPRVKQAESDQIVEAMRRKGLPVEYVIYDDEGHGFARPANRLHFYAMAEQFLARHLGGRCEPIGEIRGHSARVR